MTITKEQYLNQFWNRFLKAYNEASLPQGDKTPLMPYISYNVETDNLDHPVFLYGDLYYHSNSMEAITQMKNRIAEYIGVGGRTDAIDGGYVHITRGTPFDQDKPDNDDSVRAKRINIQVEFFTEN